MVDQGPVERRALGHYTCSYHLKSYYLLSPAILPAILPVILPVVLLVILLVILPVTFRMTPSSKIPASPPTHPRHTLSQPKTCVTSQKKSQKPHSPSRHTLFPKIPCIDRDTHFCSIFPVSRVPTLFYGRISPRDTPFYVKIPVSQNDAYLKRSIPAHDTLKKCKSNVSSTTYKKIYVPFIFF